MEDFELKESTGDNVPLVWKEIKAHSTRTFQLGTEPEVIHIIKTGFEDKYIVTWEDAYELMIGNTQILTKGEIKHKYDIEL
jgi:hypothetical protein